MLNDEYVDSGWDIQGNYAIHYPCNPGYIKWLTTDAMQAGSSYVITYIVSGYSSGIVRAEIGTTQGINRNANGTYAETIVAADNGLLRFYSDGMLRVTYVSIYDSTAGVKPGTTVCFNDAEGSTEKKWMGERSGLPELMIKFVDKMFMLKNGALWLCNNNPIRNNFFGVQYTSQIGFYINTNPTQVKLYYSMRQKSNKPWIMPDNEDIVILPVDKKPLGMKSRLKKKKFIYDKGDWFADFLRNVLDPRFDTELDALMGGEELMGSIMRLNMINSDTVEVILFTADVEHSPAMYTY